MSVSSVNPVVATTLETPAQQAARLAQEARTPGGQKKRKADAGSGDAADALFGAVFVDETNRRAVAASVAAGEAQAKANSDAADGGAAAKKLKGSTGQPAAPPAVGGASTPSAATKKPAPKTPAAAAAGAAAPATPSDAAAAAATPGRTISLTSPPGGSDAGAAAARQRRFIRVNGGAAAKKTAAAAAAAEAPLTFGDGADEYDESVYAGTAIIGTCQTVEKRYFRLTSAPTPNTVRPLPVLTKALELVKKRWLNVTVDDAAKEYEYACDQLKSIRQDLTVQHVRSEFTTHVYETHARIALEVDDLAEFTQCQTQLKLLYDTGVPGKKPEFDAYRILRACQNAQHDLGIVTFINQLKPDERVHPFVTHALGVRNAVLTDNYVTFFRLYRNAPNMAAYLMDPVADAMRLLALRVLLTAYRPRILVSHVCQLLAFASMKTCVSFLRRHTVVLVTAPAPDAVAAAAPAAAAAAAGPSAKPAKPAAAAAAAATAPGSSSSSGSGNGKGNGNGNGAANGGVLWIEVAPSLEALNAWIAKHPPPKKRGQWALTPQTGNADSKLDTSAAGVARAIARSNSATTNGGGAAATPAGATKPFGGGGGGGGDVWTKKKSKKK